MTEVGPQIAFLCKVKPPSMPGPTCTLDLARALQPLNSLKTQKRCSSIQNLSAWLFRDLLLASTVVRQGAQAKSNGAKEGSPSQELQKHL